MPQATVTFTFDNESELAQWLYGRLPQPNTGAVAQSEEQPPVERQAAGSNPASPAKRTRGPNKPKADAPQAPAAADATPPAAATTPPAAASALTADIVKGYFSKVNEKHGAEGLKKVSELVQKFGVQTIREIPQDKWPEAVALCEAELTA